MSGNNTPTKAVSQSNISPSIKNVSPGPQLKQKQHQNQKEGRSSSVSLVSSQKKSQDTIRVIKIDAEQLRMIELTSNEKECTPNNKDEVIEGSSSDNRNDMSLISFGNKQNSINDKLLKNDHMYHTLEDETAIAMETSRSHLTVTQENQSVKDYSTKNDNQECTKLGENLQPKVKEKSVSPMKYLMSSLSKRRLQMRGSTPTKSPIAVNTFYNDEATAQEDEDVDDSETYELKLPDLDHIPKGHFVEELMRDDGKVQRFYSDGRREVLFPNGVRREQWPDGYSVVYFTNGDIKQTFPAMNQRQQRTVYYFSEKKATQTTYPNGLQIFRFGNGQLEKHFQDGTKEITFPDGTIKCVFPDTSEEESIFPDGTIQRFNQLSGFTYVEYPDGTRDTLYPDGRKVREHMDGTVQVAAQILSSDRSVGQSKEQQ